MDTICVKTSDIIEIDALKYFLDECGIPNVVSGTVDGIITSLGSDPSNYSLLVLRQYLPQLIDALEQSDESLLTPQELAELKQR